MEKVKITAEVPKYLKEWINNHDVSQNALVVLGLRKLYLEEKKTDESDIVKRIVEYFDNSKMPF